MTLYEQIQPAEGKSYEAENITREQFKVFFTSCEDMSEIPDNSIHLTFTSPPYFLMRGTVPYESYKDYLGTMYQVLKELYRVTKPGRPIIINISDYQASEQLDEELVKEAEDIELGKRYDIPSHISYLVWKLNKHEATHNEIKYEDTIIWSKPGSTSNRAGTFISSGFPLKFRPNQVNERVIVFRKGDMDYRRVWKEAQRDGRYDDLDISTYDKFEDQFKLDYESMRDYLTDLWEIAPETQSDHPAPFPVELPETAIKLYSLPRETVLDPFFGFGTTALAAQKTDRKSVGYENFDAEDEDDDFRSNIVERLGADSMTLDQF